ncbi:DEAD/DEAH box helicase [Nostoc sp.]|uniref:DEAD/DEAH box helicase n=1 Tax=Nostoc sp. TaxID=1180 RepID=UPI002FF78193
MHDVVGAYQRLNHIYQLYIKSAFPLRYRSLAAERDRLLQKPGILSQPPLIEPVPIYPSSGRDLQTAVKQLPAKYHDLAQLGKMLFENGIELYQHQWESLESVLINQKDLVVTTGTGSGKTECFLLPLLAHLAWESSTWSASPSPPINHCWWDEKGDRISQWKHVTRPKAMRGLILYPLNALVEDQLRRLRKALEAPEVHHWLDRERGTNRITFGRYTGQTPIPGEPTPDKIKRLRNELDECAKQQQNLLQANLSLNPDLPYYFPRLDGGEMWSRWDMQDTPPDILITNYSMLNIMMMRSIENDIFDITRDWLAEPNHPERQFFLIIDELHAYRGTPGTEVAYILRLLFSRLGLTPDSPKLRIITTTASLEDNPEGRKFLREFFGRDDKQFAFITGQQQQPKVNARKSLVNYQNAFADFAKSVQSDPLQSMAQPDINNQNVENARLTLANQLGYSASSGTSAEKLGEALATVDAGEALRDACQAVNGSVRATNIKDLEQQLFPNLQSATNFVSDSMRGLLLALGMSKLANGRSPQPVRGHLFFHNLQSLWACCNLSCTQVEVDQIQRQTDPPTIGAIHANHRLSCGCGSRVLDLIVCEVCGDVFLGGYKSTRKLSNITVDILTPDQPNLEGIPDLVVMNQRYSNYRVFWPLPGETPAWTTQPQVLEWTADKIKRQWVKAKLDKQTGVLFQNATPPKPDEIPGWLYQVKGDDLDQPALPTKCPRCDADYGRREKFPTPLRIHRTGFQKACQVIASGLLREMPAPSQKGLGSSRKLVIFSDSRQDAAKLAAGMELDHYRDMVRLLLIQSFYQYWDDLIAFLHITAANNPASLAKLQTLNANLYNAVVQAADDITRRDRFANANPTLVTEALFWVMGLPASNQQVSSAWLGLLERYPERIPLLELRQKVRDALLECGICPGGSSFRALNYWVGQNQGQQKHPWFECYNWSGNSVTRIFPATQTQTDHTTQLEDMLTAELMNPLFDNMVRTMEGFGQGWVSYQPPKNTPLKIIQATDAVIRQLGIRRRHQYSKFFYPGTDHNLPGFAQKYIESTGLKPQDIQQQLLQSQAGISASGSLALDPNKLYLMLPSNHLGYRCDRCNAFYLHPAAGLCPECNSRTSTNKNPQQLTAGTPTGDFDYYTYLSSEKSGQPFRMNAAELTGQTDRDQRTKRQRWFQDIFINDEIARVQGIDLLSVTTTMEAGVDIGALLAVMMANMPPRRFNYQQRVGRAGRRSAGVALAVTFCRGRSHDDFYFQRPESITGDPPPPPYVDMTSVPIFERVLIKEVLRQAFAETNFSGGSDNVHGEFGNVADWNNYQPDIQDWLRDRQNEPAIITVLDSLRVQTALANASNAQMLSFLRYDLIPEIQTIVEDKTYTQDQLSERLANAGLLPMFGFPTRVRSLYTRFPARANQWPPTEGVVDRNLDIALSQFAPRSQTVKDKAVHTACGVVELYPQGKNIESKPGLVPALTEENKSLGLCGNCQAVIYPYKLLNKPHPGYQEPPKDICPVCGVDALRCLDAREPKGFFTNLQPEDFDGQFEWQPNATRPSLSVNAQVGNIQRTLNASVSAFNDHIISVNDNGGNGGFDFQNALIYGKPKPGAYAVSSDKNGPVTTSGTAYRVALLSRRKTDILLVNIEEWPTGIFADPTTVIGRAAWYSFAFWLRVAAATQLDVDAMELQAGFRSLEQNESVIGQAFLCDHLENGAGYCRFLEKPKEFKKLMDLANPNILSSIASKWINQPHGNVCDTSCNLCLRDYQNLAYHGLLDWRLALDMAQLVLSASSTIDLNSPWGSIPNPWSQLYQGINAPITATLQRLGYGLPTQFGTLTGYVHQNPKRQTILILRHPLWQDDHPEWIASEAMPSASFANAKAQTPYCNYEVKPANPFLILRRPGDYA